MMDQVCETSCNRIYIFDQITLSWLCSADCGYNDACSLLSIDKADSRKKKIARDRERGDILIKGSIQQEDTGLKYITQELIKVKRQIHFHRYK